MDSTANFTSQPIDLSKIQASSLTYTIQPSMVEEQFPRDFRYLRKRDGTVVLQGAYCWTRGWSEHGYTWRDIPTVDEP